MKRIISFALLLLPLVLFAQYDAATQYVDFLDINASRSKPYQLGKDPRTVGWMLPHFSVWLGNNFTNYGNLNDIAQAKVIDNALIQKNYDNLRQKNHLALGTEIQPIALSVKIKRKNKHDAARFSAEGDTESSKKGSNEIVTLSLSYTERILANLAFGKSAFQLVWEGNNNSNFIGNQADIYLKLNAIHLREMALGFALPLPIKSEQIPPIRVGGRIRYLQSAANLYTEKAELAMKTDKDGRYIDFNLDYRIKAALDTNFADNLPPKMLGRGIGIDLGGEISLLQERLKVGFSLLDIGAIAYKSHVYNYARNNQYRYEGVFIDVLKPEQSGDIQIDTLTQRFEPTETYSNYSSPLPTRIVLQGSYHLSKKETNKKKHPYYEHNLYLTYWQGLRTIYNGITIPYVNVGYSYNLKNILNPGVNIGYGGFNRMTAGFSLAVRAGAFRLAITSNQALMAVLNRRAATGTDFGFHAGFVF